MANEILKDEILKDEQLNDVSGGAINDRRSLLLMIDLAYGKQVGSRARVFDSLNDPDTMIARFCAQAGVDYWQNAEEPDQFKINDKWRDAAWIRSHKEEALKFFDSKLGIK